MAVLLFAISGFIVGAGPESMRAGPSATLVLIAVIVGCVAAPLVGYLLLRNERSGLGVAVAFLPLVGGLVALILPPPY